MFLLKDSRKLLEFALLIASIACIVYLLIIANKPAWQLHHSYDVQKKNFLQEKVGFNPYKTHIHFSFVFNGYNYYDNPFEILQQDGSRGIRIEFQKNNSLAVVLGGGDDIIGTPIPLRLTLGEKYNVYLRYQKGKVTFSLNETKYAINQLNSKLNLGTIRVGYGFDKKRYFNGTITDFKMKCYNGLLKIIAVILLLNLLLIYLVLKGYYGIWSSFKDIVRKFYIFAWGMVRKSKLLIVVFLLLVTTIILAYSISALNKWNVKDKIFKNNFEYTNRSYSHATGLDYNTFLFLLGSKMRDDYAKLISPGLDGSDNLPSFYIAINKKHLKKLNSNLPRSGFEQSYKGYIKINNGHTMKMKMRYRGDSPWHWEAEQKSLRINLNKGALFDMADKFNLINPPFISGYKVPAAYRVSKDLGILSPEGYLAKVFINGEYMGVQIYTEQINENMLRKYKRMPGSIYYGDFVLWEGVEGGINKWGYSNLWFNSEFWNKKASRSSEQENDRSDIQYFIDKINNANERDFFSFVNDTINKKPWFNYIALDAITGTYQHDVVHNSKIYFDPYKGRFEPIQWDLRVWHPGDYKVQPNPFNNRLHFNPILSHEIDAATYQLYQDKIDKKLIDSYTHEVKTNYNAFEADYKKDDSVVAHNGKLLRQFEMLGRKIPVSFPTKYGMRRQLKALEQDVEWLVKRKEIVMSYLNNTKLKIEIDGSKLYLYSGGNSAINVHFDKQAKRIYQNKVISTNVTEDTLYPGRIIVPNNKLIYSRGHEKVNPAFAGYIYKFNKNINIRGLKFTNAITGAEVTPEIVTDFKSNATSIHPWELPSPKPKTIKLKGKIYVNENIIYKNHQTITIQPGTIFYIAPGKSIYFYGKVTAKGTKRDPIIFKRKTKDKPWGAIILQGKDTSGSAFNNINVSGGSVAKRNLIQYTAQFNIHDNDNFTIENSTFDRNSIGDDNLHIAYSKGIIDSSIFSNSNSDAVDIDISDIKVNNNIFIDSRNDGLDVMTTTLSAKDNIFINSGDKGISIGEWSNATIDDSVIYNSYIGLAAKDKSRVVLDNIIFVNSQSEAILAYNKNSKYDEGGFVDGDNIFIRGNDKITADKRSEINIIQKNNIPPIKEFKWHKNLSHLPRDQQNILLNLN